MYKAGAAPGQQDGNFSGEQSQNQSNSADEVTDVDFEEVK
jgi:hypothetical protein